MRTERGFRDRREAGKLLARQLAPYAHRDDVVVLALPRGGVPVGYEIAEALDAPLDVLAVRKLGVPGHEELAMGAIASGGAYSLDEELIHHLGLRPEDMLKVIEAEQAELQRRESAYRDHREFPKIAGKIAILVDDGLATGQSMGVALAALKTLDPKKVIIAVPVVTLDACAELGRDAEIAYLLMPEPFYAVGLWYEDFSQISDDEVRDFLARAATRRAKA
jgi:putative phosphoribosyl transferase